MIKQYKTKVFTSFNSELITFSLGMVELELLVETGCVLSESVSEVVSVSVSDVVSIEDEGTAVGISSDCNQIRFWSGYFSIFWSNGN